MLVVDIRLPDHSVWKAWDGNPVILGKQILACLGPAAGKAEWMAVLACVLPISMGIVCIGGKLG